MATKVVTVPNGRGRNTPSSRSQRQKTYERLRRVGQTFQKETRKWLWVGQEPTRPERENVNTVKVSTFRNCWGRLGSSFISRVISTWDLVCIWKNSWNAEIRGSIDWTYNTTWITVMLRIYRTSGKPTLRWSRPSQVTRKQDHDQKNRQKDHASQEKIHVVKHFLFNLCVNRESAFI